MALDLRPLKRLVRRIVTRQGRWQAAERRRLKAQAAGVFQRLAEPIASRPHELPGRLIVSLTSYPPRFPTLARTLASLLRQEVAADELVLWIAHEDLPSLPPDVVQLQAYGLSIRTTDDLRSFKKIVPTLKAAPDAFILTADDDVFYPPDWVGTFSTAWRAQEPAVLYRRGHRIGLDGSGSPLPYMRWKPAVDARSRAERTVDVVPTGIGGILYPPNALHADVTRSELFLELCPQADDLWLYWMARLAGSTHRRVGDDPVLLTWQGSQRSSLFQSNKTGGNDTQFAALAARFGTVWRPEGA